MEIINEAFKFPWHYSKKLNFIFQESRAVSALSAVPISETTRRLYILKNQDLAAVCLYRVVAEDVAEIDFISSAEVFQREGLATKLVESLKQKFSTLWLELSEENTQAMAFYKSSGFKVVGLRQNYYKNGKNAVLMEWKSKS